MEKVYLGENDEIENPLRRNNFDLLRLMAAFQVVWGHSVKHLFLNRGYDPEPWMKAVSVVTKTVPGVPVFFLISGFLIGMSFERNSDLKEYARNRILRIYPGLYANLIIGILILGSFGFITLNFQFFSWLAAQLSIAQFYNAEMFRGFGVGVINGSLWTISVELTFYILLPFLFFIYRRKPWGLWLIGILSFFVWIYDEGSDKSIFYNKLLSVSILPFLFMFIIGMLAYLHFGRIRVLLEDRFWIWLAFFAAFAVFVEVVEGGLPLMLLPVHWVIFTGLVFSFAFSSRGLSRKILRGNDFTYGVYIYHMLVVNVWVHTQRTGSIYFLALTFVLSFVLGVVSWFLLEKPFLKLKKRSIFLEMHKG